MILNKTRELTFGTLSDILLRTRFKCSSWFFPTILASPSDVHEYSWKDYILCSIECFWSTYHFSKPSYHYYCFCKNLFSTFARLSKQIAITGRYRLATMDSFFAELESELEWLIAPANLPSMSCDVIRFLIAFTAFWCTSAFLWQDKI